MKDNVIKAVLAFTHRINDDGTYKVGFEFRADTKDIDISIATKQYRSVIDILIKNYNVSSYLHGQSVVSSQQIANLVWLLNEVDLFVNKVDQMLGKENKHG
jgi:hypothetical protein